MLKIIATKPCDIFTINKVIKIDESNFLIYELKKSKELVDFVDNPIQKPLNLQFTEIQQYISEYDLVQSNDDLDLNNFSSKDSFLKLESEKGKYLYEVEILNKNILILRISYDPRWKVYINGIEKNIIHVDYLFMGVELDSNSELVLFEFDDSIIK